MSWLSNIYGYETRSDPAPDPEPHVNTALVPPSRANYSNAVSPADAYGLAPVYRAISLITTSVRQLSLDAWRGTDVLDPPPALILAPNTEDSLAVFLEGTSSSLAATGNAFWLIDRDNQGRPNNLTVLDPQLVQFRSTDWGRVTQWQYKGNYYTPDKIRHLKLFRVPGQVKGLGPIQADQAGLRGAIDTRDYSGNWFNSSGVPAGGYLSSDQTLNAEQRTANRQAWTDATANRNGVPMLANGFTFNPLALSPKDAKWIETQSYDVTSIARLFGVPATLMLAPAEGTTITYQNVSQELSAWVRFGLMRYLSEIEDAFTAILPRGTSAKFNVEGLLRGDTTERYAAYSTAIASGWLKPSEVRAIEGLKPLPGIDAKPSVPAIPAPAVADPNQFGDSND